MLKLGLVSIVVVMLIGCAEDGSHSSNSTQVETDNGDVGLQSNQFWSVIDEMGETADVSRKLAVLTTSLNKMSPDEVASFQHQLEYELVAAYSWDLWGAAYVVNGGCSDDCFAYFRRWLISQGQSVFVEAKSDPDALADLINWSDVDDIGFEELTYIGWDIWCEKTGLTWDDLPASEVEYPSAPSGLPFVDDSADLKSRYPELWKRFGETPL